MIVFDAVGVNFYNKGAHLMLKAMQERLQYAPYPALLSVNMKLARHARRHGENLHASIWLERSCPGIADAFVSRMGGLFPAFLKKKYRLVADRDVDVILDASGFLYGDQWGLRGLRRRIASANLWASQGKRLILMPQAFGPFASTESKAHIARLIELSSLVYARDGESFGYLKEAAPNAINLRIAPDFTGLVNPTNYPEMEQFYNWVGIVPNRKMIGKNNQELYLKFLKRVISKLLVYKHKVFILIHEQNDIQLAQALSEKLEIELPIHYRDDPAELKAVIGRCRFIVASRFHAIVSALSQGVPAIGTTWSHKYRYLFDDYNVKHLLIEELENGDLVDGLLDDLCDMDYREALCRDLTRQADIQKKQIEAMWDEIFNSSKSG